MVKDYAAWKIREDSSAIIVDGKEKVPFGIERKTGDIAAMRKGKSV